MQISRISAFGRKIMAAWARSIAPSTNLSLCSSQVRHRTLTISSWVNRDECLEHGVNSFGEDRGDLSLHPTVKPVAMVADAIRDCSHRRGIVLDAFVGSPALTTSPIDFGVSSCTIPSEGARITRRRHRRCAEQTCHCGALSPWHNGTHHFNWRPTSARQLSTQASHCGGDGRF